jgi:hypothetical protein
MPVFSKLKGFVERKRYQVSANSSSILYLITKMVRIYVPVQFSSRCLNYTLLLAIGMLTVLTFRILQFLNPHVPTSVFKSILDRIY